MNESHMLAPVARRFGIVLTLTFPIHHEVDCGAVALACYAGLAVFKHRHVAIDHNFDRAIYAPIALWQCGLGLVGDFCDSLTPGSASRIAEIRRGDVIPGKLCYDCHCPIPLAEGLTLGL